ncbi:MAG: type I-B CRISPR-associated protein Cas7/Cst2/DevR [Planctomycetaceae bacterium]
MSLHVFGTILTARAVAANNRGENEGNATTLQKVIRDGDLFSTVSSEAIRYAIREVWMGSDDLTLNRTVNHTGSDWADKEFKKGWERFIDNDVLGFMHAKKETNSRRGILEISRAVSVTPWPGTVSTNFSSPGSNPGVTHNNPIPYAAEMHDTRYQFTMAMTPEALECKDQIARTEDTLRAIQNLRRVGGNHSRYLYDFSPEAIVLRVTNDPAPRIMFCFDENDHGELSLHKLIRRMQGTEPDVPPTEVIIGSAIDGIAGEEELQKLGATVLPGVKAAFSEAIKRISERLS